MPKTRRTIVVGSLTTREIEVLDLLAEGHSLRKVGELLGIDKETVEHHIYMASLRLGASGLEQTYYLARKKELVPKKRVEVPDGADSLTSSQLQKLMLAAQGVRAREAADILCISRASFYSGMGTVRSCLRCGTNWIHGWLIAEAMGLLPDSLPAKEEIRQAVRGLSRKLTVAT